jgi:GNAT superfamily N-acetyltransferase
MTVVTIHHLELLETDTFRSKHSSLEGVTVLHPQIPSPELQRFLYRAVGGDYHWTDKMNWSRQAWLEACQRWELHVLYVSGTIAGYFDLEPQGEAGIEIAYFGLLPNFAGKGLGAHLLSVAVTRARTLGATRVHLNTCSLDGPAALANYEARGFRVYKTEVLEKELAAVSPSFWATAF